MPCCIFTSRISIFFGEPRLSNLDGSQIGLEFNSGEYLCLDPWEHLVIEKKRCLNTYIKKRDEKRHDVENAKRAADHHRPEFAISLEREHR